MFGISILSVVPLRSDPKDCSEMVSQVLFGEHFKIIDNDRQWLKVKMAFDDYEGWIDSKQMTEISAYNYEQLSKQTAVLSSDLVDLVADENSNLKSIVLGSSLNFINFFASNFIFEGLNTTGQKPKNSLVETAYLYLNSPYLWGGKTPFGIDCSGFTQMVYKLCGYALLRDASQQSTQGESLSFIEESEPGDLAFFDNDEGKIIHVGMILKDNYIIHSSGQVRIDRLDHLGIYNAESQKHTHKLRVIKKII